MNKTLLLTLDTFSKTGGIQQVCKSLCYTLKSIDKSICPKRNFSLYALYDNYPDNAYISNQQFKGFKGKKIHFVIKAIVKGVISNTIIISHINLIPIVFIIKLFHKNLRIIMLAHGVEVWQKVIPWKINFIKKHVKIWAVSKFTSQKLQQVHLIKPANIIVLNNCLGPFFNPPAQFHKPSRLLQKYGLSENQPVLLSISRIELHDREKGHKLIIEALSEILNEFPNLHYFICGKKDIREKRRLQRLIMRKNLMRNVSLVEHIADHELSDYMRLADVFVLPSKKEGFGLVFIEAAACGCKIISGNADGSTDAMLNGKLGTMVNPECQIEITQAILQNLRQTRDQHTALKIQNICVSHFSYQIYKEKVAQLLTD